MKTNNNPFRDLKLTKEEAEIEKALKAGGYKEVENVAELKKAYERAADNTLSKLKKINVRLSARDLERLKAKAAENGLPYQTLVATLIRQYADEKIKLNL